MENTPSQPDTIPIRYRVSLYTRLLLNQHFEKGKYMNKWKTREEWLRILIDEPMRPYEKIKK